MSKKILLVDDDREWNFLLKLRLEKAGFEIAQAYNGKEAIQMINKNMPDLVFMDINMPELDGWETCEQLRAKTDTENLPIIIVSSYNHSDDVDRGKKFKIKRYHIKPCSPNAIVQSAQEILDKK